MDSKREKDAPRSAGRKPKYVKPALLASYTQKELNAVFGTAYGQSHVDLFRPTCPPGPWPPSGPCPSFD